MSVHDPDFMEQMNKIQWFHRIDLGNGVITPGIDDTPTKLEQVHFPADLTGKTVLDIGAWDGFFSFEAEKRGASRVVSLDGGVWKVPTIGRLGYEFARKALGSKAETIELEVVDITPERVGTYDLVLFLGVLYHLPDPLGSFLKVAAVAKDEIIIETHVDLIELDTPAIAVYPGTECAHDTTNWCGPNQAAMEGMLRLAGFTQIQSFPVTTPVSYEVAGRDPSTFGRQVFHAKR